MLWFNNSKQILSNLMTQIWVLTFVQDVWFTACALPQKTLMKTFGISNCRQLSFLLFLPAIVSIFFTLLQLWTILCGLSGNLSPTAMTKIFGTSHGQRKNYPPKCCLFTAFNNDLVYSYSWWSWLHVSSHVPSNRRMSQSRVE